MPWSYRGLGVESEWRKSGFREEAQKAGGRRKGDVGEVADTRRKIEMECSDDESAMAKKADGSILNTSLHAVVGHKC